MNCFAAVDNKKVHAIIFLKNRLKRFIVAKITATKTHTSGIALGGIGSESVEFLPGFGVCGDKIKTKISLILHN